ncbi:MAG: hypothetical protein QOH06_511 [Acidobacteriota bacterium]|jgi:predicted transcriptional regulator|nr:hypothetical protein [Acidobacteriota bacterium]
MTFELPASLERKLRDLAEVRSRQVPDLVEEAVRQYLEGASTSDVREQRGQGSWEEIRRQFPRQWLLVEAIAAHSAEGKRVLDDIAVLDAFQEAGSAMKSYQETHRRSPQREIYVVHTDRDALDIAEIDWLGIRTA